MATDQIEPLITSIAELTKALHPLAKPPVYTLTGASDWPLLMAMGGILLAVLGFMWVDLRNTFKDHVGKNEKDLQELWNQFRTHEKYVEQEFKECKEKCCG